MSPWVAISQASVALVAVVVALRVNTLAGLPGKISGEIAASSDRLEKRLDRMEDKLDRHVEKHGMLCPERNRELWDIRPNGE